jgi:Ni/Fe-hydrogenase subunit HybB-like protein
MELTEILGGTLNIAILACFYTVFGALISYLLFHVFDDFNEEWQKSSLGYQLLDISAEISLVGIIAFWSSFVIKVSPVVSRSPKARSRSRYLYFGPVFCVCHVFVFGGSF